MASISPIREASPVFTISPLLLMVVLPVVTASKLEELWTRVFWIGSQYVIDVIFAALLSRKGFKAVGERERWLRSNFHY